ncbi:MULTISPECIES: hypothetical protein [Listeria]|uniref:hypothetical protein n=1 Tax=Listeria TaxID=1637 RepID=UPI000B595D71|nr:MULTISPECIES: hypothetical protein [Listeria]
MALTQKRKELWTMFFSIISLFIPFGLIIAIPTLIISRNAVRTNPNTINKSTKIISIISIVLSTVIIVLMLIGAITFFLSKGKIN